MNPVVQKVAKALYREVCETCDGYVERFRDDEPISGLATVDGNIDYEDLARAAIEALGLTEMVNSIPVRADG